MRTLMVPLATGDAGDPVSSDAMKLAVFMAAIVLRRAMPKSTRCAKVDGRCANLTCQRYVLMIALGNWKDSPRTSDAIT